MHVSSFLPWSVTFFFLQKAPVVRPVIKVVSLSFLAGVCGCCGPLRPRYKRLVDNIFPEDPKVSNHKHSTCSINVQLRFGVNRSFARDVTSLRSSGTNCRWRFKEVTFNMSSTVAQINQTEKPLGAFIEYQKLVLVKSVRN